MTTDQLIETLSHAKAISIKFTVPEGLRTDEIAEKLASEGLVNKDEFMRLVREGQFEYSFLNDRPEGATLEGYLFPDTYFVPQTYTEKEIIDTMLQNFDKKFTPEMRQQVAANGKTIHEIVTMASVVEREVHVADERKTVAGVFYNRLAAGMPLQSDPTVQYVVGQEGNWWPDGLTQENLDTDSPYNTYRNTGLPPGPICNPGAAAMEAAAAPEQTNYLYFEAKETGRTYLPRITRSTT